MSNDQNDQPAKIVAAVDLGSNSFHMIVASIEENGTLKVIDRLKEMVLLGAGLDENNYLDDETQERALECLSRFSQRLQGINKRDIRIAGTNTLRVAKNSHKFIRAAKKILDHKIEIISGVEEARLVYHGAIYSLAELGKQRLVVDIGGGSTEFIIGKKTKPIKLESLTVGSVSLTKRFFADGVITKTRIKRADIYVRLKIEEIRKSYIDTGWEQCVGTSGSIRSISKVLLASEISDGSITPKALNDLLEQLLKFSHISEIKLEGLSSDRQPIFLGGVIVLNSAFKSLGLADMTVSDGALREGLMLDIVGRIKHQDIRELSISQMASRFDVRQQHVDNITATCDFLYQQISPAITLDENLYRLLTWAIQLHELGLAISHSGYHKHGAYLILNSDMPGFSMQEQQLVALLVRYHRKNVTLEDFELLQLTSTKKMIQLVILIRLSVLLNRSIATLSAMDYTFEIDAKTIKFKFPVYWFDEHPLTMADLDSEVEYLKKIGYKLKIKALN